MTIVKSITKLLNYFMKNINFFLTCINSLDTI